MKNIVICSMPYKAAATAADISESGSELQGACPVRCQSLNSQPAAVMDSSTMKLGTLDYTSKKQPWHAVQRVYSTAS
eukprot:364731-Chlamydomonas_euryale.AAC.14